MAGISYKQEILEQLDRLDTEQQRQVLAFMRSLSTPQGIPGWLFIERTKNLRIDLADLEIMKQAIEEDCERIDPDEWDDKPIFPS
jgi:hypothetical protein